MALPPPGARQTGPYQYTGPTQEEIDAYRLSLQQPETSGEDTAPPPAEGASGDFGGLEPAPSPAPAPAPAPALPPPPPGTGAGGGAFESSFVQPGTPAAAPFRTPEFFSGRMSGPPQMRRMGPGSPIGGMVDLGGGNPFQGDDDTRRRLLAAIIGGRR
jgi:hypothetical protein